MNKQVKTKGIVLKRINFNEADQIITILTKDEGRVSLIAKGARRLKSRFCGRLEPFSHIEVNYFQGQNLGHLNEAVLIKGLDSTALSLRSQSQLFYMLESTEKLIPEAQDSLEVYELLLEVNSVLKTHFNNALFYAYMIKMLTILGFMGQWDRCSQTNKKIDLNASLYLDQEAGVQMGVNSSQFNTLLSPGVVRWVNYIQKQPLDRSISVAPTLEQQSEMFRVMKAVLSTLLNKPFKSEVFLKQTYSA